METQSATREQPRVLVCDPIHREGMERLREKVQVDVVEGTGLAEAELIAQIPQYDAIIVRSRTAVPAGVIEAGARLKVIGRAGSGLDHIDIAAARRHNVRVINSPDANTISVTEHTFALMLALARHLPQANQSMKAGRWEKKALMGVSLEGKILGVIGFGRIGHAVARRAQAFGMRVAVNQPRLTPQLALARGVHKYDLPDLLRDSDFLTLHVPLRPENVGLIGAEELAQMKPTACVINTSRGGIVDEGALLDALQNGQIAGAGLDVFTSEPDVNLDLVRHSHVIATPHIAASTEDAQRTAAVTVAEQILTVLD